MDLMGLIGWGEELCPKKLLPELRLSWRMGEGGSKGLWVLGKSWVPTQQHPRVGLFNLQWSQGPKMGSQHPQRPPKGGSDPLRAPQHQ